MHLETSKRKKAHKQTKKDNIFMCIKTSKRKKVTCLAFCVFCAFHTFFTLFVAFVFFMLFTLFLSFLRFLCFFCPFYAFCAFCSFYAFRAFYVFLYFLCLWNLFIKKVLNHPNNLIYYTTKLLVCFLCFLGV